MHPVINRVFTPVSLLLTICAGLSVQAALADDFSGRYIDSSLWADQEIIRKIRARKLITGFRQTDRTASGRVFVIDPLSVNQVEAEVRVLSARAVGTAPRAYIAGLFFSDGPAGAGVENAVFAEVNMTYTGSDLDVQFEIGRCNDPQCLTWTDFFFDTTTVPNVSLRTTHRMGLKWDGAFGFEFRFDGYRVGYDTSADVRAIFPPGFPFRQIGTRVFNPAGTGFAAMRAAIDNVRINGSSYDRFSTPRLDPSRWSGDRLEITRKINRRDEVFVSRLRRSGTGGNNQMNLKDPLSANFLAADVEVKTSSILASGVDAARARARLTGYWYNDGSPLDGEVGEVQAEIRIIDRNRGGPLDIQYFVARCDNADCSAQSNCAFNGAFGSTVTGNRHRLSINWDKDNNALIFGLDGRFEQVTPGGVGCAYAEPSRVPFKGIGTRIDSLNGSEEADITAVFDDVEIF